MEETNIDQLINAFYSDQIAKQLGDNAARDFAVHNSRIHLNKLIVIVSNLGKKDLALEYHKILIELNKIQFS